MKVNSNIKTNIPVKGMIKNFKNKYLKKVGSIFSNKNK